MSKLQRDGNPNMKFPFQKKKKKNKLWEDKSTLLKNKLLLPTTPLPELELTTEQVRGRGRRRLPVAPTAKPPGKRGCDRMIPVNAGKTNVETFAVVHGWSLSAWLSVSDWTGTTAEKLGKKRNFPMERWNSRKTGNFPTRQLSNLVSNHSQQPLSHGFFKWLFGFLGEDYFLSDHLKKLTEPNNQPSSSSSSSSFYSKT